MPLTKSDLDQIEKAVRKVVREEVEAEVKDSTRTLDTQIRMSKIQVQHDISELDDRMKNVEVRVDNIQKDIKTSKKDLRYISKTVDIIAKNYDEEDVKLNRRVRRIEQHLMLPEKN